MWEFSNNRQLFAFLVSLALGLAFAIAYSVLRGIRLAVRHSALAINIEDIIFCEIISFITFLFALALTSGEIRLFMLLGILIGFLVFHFTLSALFAKILSVVIRSIGFILLKIKGFISGVLGFFGKTVRKIVLIISKLLQKSIKYIKKHLKAVGNMVYTRINKHKSNAAEKV